MSNVRQPTPAREYVENKKNQVIAIAEARPIMFRFTNSEGAVDVGLAFICGKDADGGPGVWVVEPARLREFLSPPQQHIKKGIRAMLGMAPAETPAPALAISDAELDSVDLDAGDL